MLDIWVDSGKSNAQLYDEMKCENGPAPPPGVPKRIGCINAGTEFENRNEYKRLSSLNIPCGRGHRNVEFYRYAQNWGLAL